MFVGHVHFSLEPLWSCGIWLYNWFLWLLALLVELLSCCRYILLILVMVRIYDCLPTVSYPTSHPKSCSDLWQCGSTRVDFFRQLFQELGELGLDWQLSSSVVVRGSISILTNHRCWSSDEPRCFVPFLVLTSVTPNNASHSSCLLFQVRGAGYRLKLDLPKHIDVNSVKAKFTTKKKELRITAPVVDLE